MTQHASYADTQQHHDEAGLADLLNLDAQAFAPYLDRLTGWVGQHVLTPPRRILDLGAGTGTGSLALARRFSAAEVVAVDTSALMLERLRAAALEQGVGHRVRAVQADLDLAPPAVGGTDLAWAASSLHHVADPDRVLRDVHAALGPGGLLVVIEMDDQPRFLPDDIGMGRPGLEARCHRVMAQAKWNSHPNWRPHLERAGFEIAEERCFPIKVDAAPPSTRHYARTYLSRVRSALDGQLAPDDLETQDHLLGDGPHALLRRTDLEVRSSRTAWAALRPGYPPNTSPSAFPSSATP